MRNGEVFRTEGNIILGNGGDDLIFRMLENRPDTMPGAACAPVSSNTLFPNSVTCPASGAASPAMMRESVDLPDPFGPARHTRSPWRTVRFTPSSAQVAPES